MGDLQDGSRLVILIGIGYGVDRRLIQALLGPGTLPIQSTLSTASAGLLGLVHDITGAALCWRSPTTPSSVASSTTP